MFITKQRNLILNISEFIQEKKKDVNNLKNVNIKSDDIIFEKFQIKIAKSLMYIDNRMNLEN